MSVIWFKLWQHVWQSLKLLVKSAGGFNMNVQASELNKTVSENTAAGASV